MNTEDLLRRTYAAFNARDFGTALAAMHPDVSWPNGMAGGTVHGHSDVRAFHPDGPSGRRNGVPR
jgi:hypothetical protein